MRLSTSEAHRRRGIRGAVAILLIVAAVAIVHLLGEARSSGRPGFDLPSSTRIYARPLVLQAGLELDRAALERHLRRLGYRSRSGPSNLSPGEYALDWRRWTIHRRPFRLPDGVEAGGILVVQRGWDGRIRSLEDASGARLARATLPPEPIGIIPAPGAKDRLAVPLEDVPPHLIQAVLSIEDQRFYRHAGLDFRRIVAAAWANLRARRIVQGGSTLTQQLVKNLYLSSRRSPIRKLREAAIALAIERRYTKDEILAAYLNEIYLGQDGALAIHGVGRAAEYYFGLDVTELDLAHSALLAGMIRGPMLYSPFRNPITAQARRDLVLREMRERNVITDAEYRSALARPIELRSRPRPLASARYFVDFLEAQLRRRHGNDAVRDGLTVFSSLDLALQRHAERALRDGLEQLEREAPYLAAIEPPLQAALIALDPHTGAVRAMIGGRDYGATQFNRAVTARRQPGSAFKPIVALAALARPRPADGGPPEPPEFTLASILEDEPLTIRTAAGTWEPGNYDQSFRGPITLRHALERSLNVPFARLGLAIGPERIARAGGRLGIESRLRRVPSLALGSSEVTPLELTRAYGVLAAGGYRADLRPAIAVLARDGRTLEGAAGLDAAHGLAGIIDLHASHRTGERVYDPAEAYLVTSALRGAVERGTGRGLRRMGYRGPVAGKSGTSDDFRDAWFVGYTPDLVIGVWVGYDDGRSVGLPGASAALPIFARFLLAAFGPNGGEAEFVPPDGLELVRVDPRTGLVAAPGCGGELEVFLDGTSPTRTCSPFFPRAATADRDRVRGDDVRRRLGERWRSPRRERDRP